MGLTAQVAIPPFDKVSQPELIYRFATVSRFLVRFESSTLRDQRQFNQLKVGVDLGQFCTLSGFSHPFNEVEIWRGSPWVGLWGTLWLCTPCQGAFSANKG